MGVRQALAACGVIVVLSMVGAAATASTLPPRVTVIADSAFGAVVGNRDSRAILNAGFEMKIDVGICRRLTGTSCPYQGVEPPTLIDVVHSLGSGIAPTVIVEVGYNDFAETFPQAVEDAIDALLAAGVKRILWVTMAEGRSQYVPMNGMLGAVAGRHPEVRLVDWANTSRSHESWFLGDGVHLTYDGALGMARLLHAVARRRARVAPRRPQSALADRAPRKAIHSTANRPRRSCSVPLASDIGQARGRLPSPARRRNNRVSSPDNEDAARPPRD